MRIVLLLVASACMTTAALGAETGCDKLSWPLDNERVALTKPADAAPGESAVSSAIAVKLMPDAETKFILPPERRPKDATALSGVARFAAPAQAGEYFVTVSQNAWIDVIQGERFIKPGAFTGVLECPGVRKSLRVRLDAKPFVIQFSDSKAATAAVMVTPAR